MLRSRCGCDCCCCARPLATPATVADRPWARLLARYLLLVERWLRLALPGLLPALLPMLPALLPALLALLPLVPHPSAAQALLLAPAAAALLQQTHRWRCVPCWPTGRQAAPVRRHHKPAAQKQQLEQQLARQLPQAARLAAVRRRQVRRRCC